jgi:hypothetical protein
MDKICMFFKKNCDKNTHHSTFGFCFLLAYVVVSWANWKTTFVVLLTLNLNTCGLV